MDTEAIGYCLKEISDACDWITVDQQTLRPHPTRPMCGNQFVSVPLHTCGEGDECEVATPGLHRRWFCSDGTILFKGTRLFVLRCTPRFMLDHHDGVVNYWASQFKVSLTQAYPTRSEFASEPLSSLSVLGLHFVSNCSGEMSVYEKTEIEHFRCRLKTSVTMYWCACYPISWYLPRRWGSPGKLRRSPTCRLSIPPICLPHSPFCIVHL